MTTPIGTGVCGSLAASLVCWAVLGQEVASPQFYRLEIADCDDVAFGPDGDLYFACHSPEDRLPLKVRGAKTVPDEMDAYVLRLTAHTGKLVFATRLAAKSFDAALRIAVDRDGNAYATGVTRSLDFPVTPNALQKNLRGQSDAFLVKISSTGEITYSTLIGGSGDDLGNGLDIDNVGTVYVGGVTSSTDFPGRPSRKTAGGDDAFVCRTRPAEREVLCRVFGGREGEKLTGIALDGERGIYATGVTSSSDFPMKHPVQKALRGNTDLFLARLAVPSLDLTFSTVLGGSGDDSGWGIAVDREGNPVVAGITDSEDLPGSAGSYQPRKHGKKDAFVSSVRVRDGRGIRTTYFGGSGDDESGYDGSNVKVDQHGNVWMVGITYSDDLPTRNASQNRFGGGNGDGFISAFDPQLKRLCFASYSGDKERNLLEGLAISTSGLVAATGVSLREGPSAVHIRIGNSGFYAGHNVVLLAGSDVCAPR